MNVLVTGGAGFIGAHVARRYVEAGHAVAVVDDLSTGRRDRVPPSVRFYQVDIRSRELADVFATERPEAVSHHAAQAAVRRSVAEPIFDASVNILGTLNLLECARRIGVRRLIFASSGGAIYGDTTRVPTREEHPTEPASPYGVSKLAAERYIDCFGRLSGASTLALRYANVYGPGQNTLGEAGVVAIFCHRLLHGEPVVVNGAGTQTRDYVYVDDVAEANLAALDRPEVRGALNIATGVETSVLELWARLQEAAGLTGLARHGPAKPGEQGRSVLDASRARERLGWVPRVSLDEGLRRTVEGVAGTVPSRVAAA